MLAHPATMELTEWSTGKGEGKVNKKRDPMSFFGAQGHDGCQRDPMEVNRPIISLLQIGQDERKLLFRVGDRGRLDDPGSRKESQRTKYQGSPRVYTNYRTEQLLCVLLELHVSGRGSVVPARGYHVSVLSVNNVSSLLSPLSFLPLSALYFLHCCAFVSSWVADLAARSGCIWGKVWATS